MLVLCISLQLQAYIIKLDKEKFYKVTSRNDSSVLRRVYVGTDPLQRSLMRYKIITLKWSRVIAHQ